MAETTTQTSEAEDDGDARGANAFDPELLAMNRMLKMLAKIEEPGRSRVVGYLVSRFGPPPAPAFHTPFVLPVEPVR